MYSAHKHTDTHVYIHSRNIKLLITKEGLYSVLWTAPSHHKPNSLSIKICPTTTHSLPSLLSMEVEEDGRNHTIPKSDCNAGGPQISNIQIMIFLFFTMLPNTCIFV
jgi:hypothetical protein